MKAAIERGPIDEILSCFDKIKTIELAMASLPNEFISGWREGVAIKEKRERLQAEIVELRDRLKDKMNVNSTQ